MARRSKFSQQEVSPLISGSLFNQPKKSAADKPAPSTKEMLKDSKQLLNSLVREFTKSVDNAHPSANFLSELPTNNTTPGISR